MSTNDDAAAIDELVAVYDAEFKKIDLFREQLLAALMSSDPLADLIHSTRTRMKHRDHLRDKLVRKSKKAQEDGAALDVTPENLLTTINDLAGVRLLHVHTRQIRDIDAVLKEILSEQQYELREGPFARTWDDESRAFFEECGIATQQSPTMYTSVHYVVGSASRTVVTCEIQVRTLMEEVWGEVDHAINYPHPCSVLACREQLKVLARATSTATRLVDATFLTFEDARQE